MSAPREKGMPVMETKVKAGQRYQEGGRVITARHYLPAVHGWAYCENGKVDDGWTHDGACCWYSDDWFKTATLVAPSPSLSAPMAEREYEGDVMPVGCLRCGTPVDLCTFVCQPCVRVAAKGEIMGLHDAWFERKERDFPRPSKPSPGAEDLGATRVEQGLSAQRKPLTVNDIGTCRPMTAFEVIEQRERTAAERRAETAAVLAGFANEWDLLRDT